MPYRAPEEMLLSWPRARKFLPAQASFLPPLVPQPVRGNRISPAGKTSVTPPSPATGKPQPVRLPTAYVWVLTVAALTYAVA
jgi:hypothetical protein